MTMQPDDIVPRLQVSAGGVVYRALTDPPGTFSGRQTGTGPPSRLHRPPPGPARHNRSAPLPGQKPMNTVYLDDVLARPERLEVALIRVGRYNRWQLPKGTVEADETREDAALREVREETGLTAEIIEPIETIEYRYRCMEEGQWIHFHKFVSFYLMRFIHGSVMDHDHEVQEARWVEIGLAIRMLAFDNERRLVVAARHRLR